MSVEQNKASVRRYYEEVWNKGNLAVIDELFAPDYVNHDPATPGGGVRGREAFKQLTAMYHTVFPDLTMTIEDQIGEGDTVVTRWTARGTQQGELMGIPPTGKQGTVSGLIMTRFSGGTIVEEHAVWDTLGLLQQLGAIPAPA